MHSGSLPDGLQIRIGLNTGFVVVGSLDGETGITTARLWAVMKRFFADAAEVIGERSPGTAEKLR